MLEMSWITAILFGNVIVKRIDIRLFDSLAQCHYILNSPRTLNNPMDGHNIIEIPAKDSSLLLPYL